MVDELYELYKDKGITKIVGIESRGFVLSSALALKLNAGVVLCRKPGKLQQGIWQGHHRDTQGRYHRRRRGVASRRPPRHWRHNACGIQPGEEVQSEEHLREFHHRTGSRESQRQG